MNWQKLNRPQHWLAFGGATVLGTGLLPKAPGTFGSLVAIPLVFYSLEWEPIVRISVWALIALFGIWSTKIFEGCMDSKDHSSVVIDEVVGMGIATWLLEPDLLQLGIGFLIFRFFDIVKWPPVRQIDVLSKSSQNNWVTATGVILDDAFAGLQTCLIIWMMKHLYFF